MRFHINAALRVPLQLQLIEQTYLDPTQDKNTDDKLVINGVQYDKSGQIEGYWIDIDPSGTNCVQVTPS